MKLHIGCGTKYIDGYKHLDVMPHPHIDFLCDTRKLDVIETASVTDIYACHILEHVERIDIPAVLREWARVLVSGGHIRIAVPDFEAVVQEYLSGTPLACLQGLLYGGQTYDYNFHYVAFDFKSLSQLLSGAGFEAVERYRWQEFLPADYDDYSRAYWPHMDFENGRLMSLNVIARKS